MEDSVIVSAGDNLDDSKLMDLSVLFGDHWDEDEDAEKIITDGKMDKDCEDHGSGANGVVQSDGLLNMDGMTGDDIKEQSNVAQQCTDSLHKTVTLHMHSNNRLLVRVMYSDFYCDSLVDSGAASSCISSEFLGILGIGMQNVKKNLDWDMKTTTGSPIQVAGTIALLVQLGEKSVFHEFVVTTDVLEYLILGVELITNKQIFKSVDFVSGEIKIFI